MENEIRCYDCKYRNFADYNDPCCHCTMNCAGDKQKLFFESRFADTDKTTENDNVNHPNHYTGKYECIDVMVETQGIEAAKNFCTCNAFKYLWWHDKKNGVEDVKKAAWYLNKFIELEERSKDE